MDGSFAVSESKLLGYLVQCTDALLFGFQGRLDKGVYLSLLLKFHSLSKGLVLLPKTANMLPQQEQGT